MNFMGKICPYCKSEFKEDDEVVICSVCEMPHHKDCWLDNKACTTFGCTGTIMGNDNYDSSQAQQQSLNYNQSQYTNQVSSFNYDQSNTNYDSYIASIEADTCTFVSENQEYFSRKFEKLNLKNSKASWNWASAFLGAYWYAYRKMYLIQFLYYIASLFIVGSLAMLIVSSFSNTHTFTPILAFLPLLILIIPFVLSGLFGNYLYKRHVEKHVKIARNMDSNMKYEYLIKKGGINPWAVWTIIVINIVLKIL